MEVTVTVKDYLQEIEASGRPSGIKYTAASMAIMISGVGREHGGLDTGSPDIEDGDILEDTPDREIRPGYGSAVELVPYVIGHLSHHQGTHDAVAVKSADIFGQRASARMAAVFIDIPGLHHVGVVGHGELVERGEMFRADPVIGIDEAHKLSARGLHSCITGSGETPVLAMNHMEAGITGSVFLADITAFIRGTVVNEYALPVGECLV